MRLWKSAQSCDVRRGSATARTASRAAARAKVPRRRRAFRGASAVAGQCLWSRSRRDARLRSEATLICRDCGGSFAFSEDERRSFALQGHLHPPSRCAACRETRRARQSTSGARPMPPAFRELNEIRTPVVCSGCGQSAVVPFAVRTGRPVYCLRCYRPRRAAREDG